MPQSRTRSMSNAISFPAIRSALSVSKRFRIGGRRLRPDQEATPSTLVRPEPSSRDNPIRPTRRRGRKDLHRRAWPWSGRIHDDRDRGETDGGRPRRHAHLAGSGHGARQRTPRSTETAASNWIARIKPFGVGGGLRWALSVRLLYYANATVPLPAEFLLGHAVCSALRRQACGARLSRPTKIRPRLVRSRSSRANVRCQTEPPAAFPSTLWCARGVLCAGWSTACRMVDGFKGPLALRRYPPVCRGRR
jgi:hypothetical protein